MAALSDLRTWHRRLSLVVGAQLLLWTVGGLVFSWDPIEVVRGETSLAPAEQPTLPPLAGTVAPEWALAAVPEAAPSELALCFRRQRWVWELRPEQGAATLIDARSREPLAPVDAAEARELAEARFLPLHETVTVTEVTEATGEFRGRDVPAWRVSFDDDDHHALYVDALSGEITAVRNDTWRRFDFLWMLHIMDYAERDDFGTPWLKLAALLGVLTSASGLGLGLAVLWQRRRGRRRG